MDNIVPEMSLHVRYWMRLIAVFDGIVHGDETPGLIIEVQCMWINS